MTALLDSPQYVLFIVSLSHLVQSSYVHRSKRLSIQLTFNDGSHVHRLKFRERHPQHIFLVASWRILSTAQWVKRRIVGASRIFYVLLCCLMPEVHRIADMNQISMFVLVHLFSSGVFGVEISPRDGEDSPASSEHRRTLLSIIWGCLATIFVCTWLSVHPNVPGHKITTRGPISCTIERMKIMVTAILAPEVIVAWAAQQFIVAWTVCYSEYFMKSRGYPAYNGGQQEQTFLSHQ